MPDQNLPTIDAPEIKIAAEIMVRLAVQFGVGVGLVCGLWLLGLHLTGNNAFGPKHIIVYFLVPLAVIASQWVLRQRLAPAKPGLGRALAVGVLTAVLAASVAAASVIGVGNTVGKQAMDRNRQEMLVIAKVERANIEKLSGKAGYQSQLEHLARVTVQDIALNDFRSLLLVAIFALPGAVFFRE
jgi:hypothetical protein